MPSTGDQALDADTLATGQRPAVLCVDDEPDNLALLERALRRRFDVLTVTTPEQALEVLRARDDVAVVLSDYRLPQMSGAELLAAAARLRPETRRVLVTGFADTDNLVRSINDGGVHHVLRKPWSPPALLQLLDELVRSHQLERENRRLVDQLRAVNERLAAREVALERALRDRGLDLDTTSAELERVQRELEVLSYRDALTGVYNHRAFQERLREEVSRAQRYGQPLALLLIDVDGFVSVNQDLGYQAGDELLRKLAHVLVSSDSSGRTRASDIIARYAGEEFAVLLPETGKAGAITKANRLREAVLRAEPVFGRAVTISVGASAMPDDADDPDSLVQAAEAALRGAKRHGKNRVHFVSQGELGAGPRESVAVVLPPEPPALDRFRPFHERMGEVNAILQHDRAVACLYLDLARLRRVEAEFGVTHRAELYELAGEALDALRGALLRPGDLVCRTGDDDAYVVILAPREHWGHDQLETLATRVEQALEGALAAAVRELLRDRPRLTVGFARVLGNALLRPERLVNRLVGEAAESARLLRHRASLRDKASLQDLILGDGLTPVYQPLVHLESGDIFGYEALTRGPRGTPLESPATLFGIADEVGLTFELDRACFRGALRGSLGLEPVHRLFVNLLPLSFYDTGFIELEVSQLLEAAALTPANIVFEITERLAIENFNSFRRALGSYTAMGFGVAIDDVGTRHSNLETVMALRPDFIKISDVLSRGVARSTVKREMLRSLGHIAETIDAVMVAEGIETADDLAVLHDLGVKYGQGYFLARPGPPFPRLRRSVRRAIVTLVEGMRGPISESVAIPTIAPEPLAAVGAGPAPAPASPPSDGVVLADDDEAEETGPNRVPRHLVTLVHGALKRRPAASSAPFPLVAPPVDDGDEDVDGGEAPAARRSAAWRPLEVPDAVEPERSLLSSLRRDFGDDGDDPRDGTQPGKRVD